MSANKHTPGPWALESVQTSFGSCHKIGPFPSAGIRSEVHACVYADRLRLGRDDESPIAVELLANARLIAAAPDLLNALMVLADVAEARGIPCDAARAAIAKATGGAA